MSSVSSADRESGWLSIGANKSIDYRSNSTWPEALFPIADSLSSLLAVECPPRAHYSDRAFKLDFVGEHVCDLKRSPNTPFHVTALSPAARPSPPSLPSLCRSPVGGSLESENGLAFSGAQPSDQSRPPCCFNNILACTKWMVGCPVASARGMDGMQCWG